MSDLIRNALGPLQSYKLDEKYASASTNKPIDQKASVRYEEARNKYLQQRIEEMMMEYVATFDGETFEMPEVEATSPSEVNLVNDVKSKATNVTKACEDLLKRYTEFGHKRAELESVVADLGDMASDDMDDENDADVTEEEMKAEENLLHELRQKKAALQQKLQSINASAEAAEASCFALRPPLLSPFLTHFNFTYFSQHPSSSSPLTSPLPLTVHNPKLQGTADQTWRRCQPSVPRQPCLSLCDP